MAKNKGNKNKKKKKINPPKTTIKELEDSRNGGQIALVGFTYQFLYSCFLILSQSEKNTTFHLEGIEDIDHYKCEMESEVVNHIQLKYSSQKQDASFLKDVLKNFLEAYLLDKTHNFKLVYDFVVAKGNMSKLFDKKLDESSIKYWKGIIEEIKKENLLWNWEGFSFDDFISKLSFERQEKSKLSIEVEKLLIEKYEITTDNMLLFVNGIEMCCLRKMEGRESIDKSELDTLIQNIKDDISKGVQNPAHKWIKRLKYDTSYSDQDLSYYEGKKATPHDIVLGLPVRRTGLENEIKKSIQEYRVTVIKASSGQGKTTIALQVAYDLQEEYKIYQLLWCNDSKELDNIVQYFKSRVKLGEKLLIIIDNLDIQLAEWNRLAQLLQEEISYHYKLLITTREDDWYNYCGDLSNVKALQVVKLTLNEKEAQSIYEVLYRAKKLHNSITDWRKSWYKVADKKLLIEYVYLLTHGEMIAERIENQISQISRTDTGRIKCEILRKICFADICGIKIPVKKLVRSLCESTLCDYGELLKSIENEFLVRVDRTEKYVEGLHPVRSQHIVDKLHEFIDIDDTIIQVVEISDSTYLEKLFFNIPKFVENREGFYPKIITALDKNGGISSYYLAMRGLFSGTVMEYYNKNKAAFDDANEHGGLYIISTEMNPFTNFNEFDYSFQLLDELQRIDPNDTNINYLCTLRDSIPKIVLVETDLYYYCEALFNALRNESFEKFRNESLAYTAIIDWLLNIDRRFNLAYNISLERIWKNRTEYSLDAISSIMYTCFCGNKENYLLFVERKIDHILSYLRTATQSIKVFINEEKKEIHVEYILLVSDIKKGNDESVKRLKYICKMLPIFDVYCADSIKPSIDILSGYNIPDDAHMTMPIRDLIIRFHQDLVSLWNKTVMSNYESDSIFEWLEYWFSIRKNIISTINISVACICKLLEGKRLGKLGDEFDKLRNELNEKLRKEYSYPNQDRPFEKSIDIPIEIKNIKSKYFGDIRNFMNQVVGFLMRDSEQSRLAMVNLRSAQSSLPKMQEIFANIVNKQDVLKEENSSLCIEEGKKLEDLIVACKYYEEHHPNRYFSKNELRPWYNKMNKQRIENAKATLNSLDEEFFITYPNKSYYEGICEIYPIIVSGLDLEDKELILKFLCLCTPMADLDFNYLLVAYMDENKIVSLRGLKIPISFLESLRTALQNEDAQLNDQLFQPVRTEITRKMLECFENEYELAKLKSTGFEGLDRVFELLWAVSKTRKELSDEGDIEYCNSIEAALKAEILETLKSFEYKINQEDFYEVFQLCTRVLEGEEYDDIELNASLAMLIEKVKNNQ